MFSEGTEREVNFHPFLQQYPHPQYSKYLNLSNFKQFQIERGNIVWGKSWDLIFPIEQLYCGQI
jgi:hypothetical protein